MFFSSKTLLKNVNICRLSCMVNSIVSQNRNFTPLNCTKDGCKSLNQGLININSNTRCTFLPKWKLKTPLYRTLSNTIFYHNKNEGNSHNESSAVMENTSKWLTVPNALTLFRMGISPWIGYLILCENFAWSLGLVVVSAATDSIDGWIARNFKGQSSVIGSYIDPLADKIFISVLILSLTMVNIIPVPLCGMVILRDILLITTSSHLHYKSLQPPVTLKKFLDFENSPIKMEPTQISKYNSFLQFGLCTISLIAPILGFLDHPLLQFYWYLVATSSVVSGCSYFFKDKSAYRR